MSDHHTNRTSKGHRTTTFVLGLRYPRIPRCPVCGDQLLASATHSHCDMLICRNCADTMPEHLWYTTLSATTFELSDHFIVRHGISAYCPTPDEPIPALKLLFQLAPEVADELIETPLPKPPQPASTQPARTMDRANTTLDLQELKAQGERADQLTDLIHQSVPVRGCSRVARSATRNQPRPESNLPLLFDELPRQAPFGTTDNEGPDCRLDPDQT